MMRVGETSPRSSQTKEETTQRVSKTYLVPICILIAFLLLEIANPNLKVDLMTSEKQIEPFENPTFEQTVDESYLFSIPKKLWIADTAETSYLSELIAANNNRIAQENGFESFFVNQDNFRPFLSQPTIEKVESFIAMIERKIWGEKSAQLQAIVNNFILLNILNENGGIMADGKCVLAEGFEWVSKIAQNKYVNRANRGIRPQIVGFYSLNHTLDKVKEDIRPFEGMNDVDRYTAVFPSLEPYFIAADKGTPFVSELIATISQLLSLPQGFKQHQINLKGIKGNIFDEYFYISVQIILQNRQRQIDSANKDPFRHFAMDYYGLSLLNCYYGPYKQYYFFKNFGVNKFVTMSKYTTQEFDNTFGPVRYIVRPYLYEPFNTWLQEARDGKREKILDGSWVQRLFFPNRNLPFIKENREKPFINQTNQQWLSLPKIIWIFYDKGVIHAPIITQVCVQSLKRMAKKSDFILIQVNNSNAHLYLDKQTLEKINYTMKNARLKTYTPSASDLFRLALISKHGGVYFDSTYFTLQSFDWIINIGRDPTQYIFNRYGHLPKVLLMWFGATASPFDWQIDEKHNTKGMWQLPYESNFIAAQKDNELIKEWFEFMTIYYLKSYKEVVEYFRQECKISEHQWIQPNYHYLFVMDSVKCVIGRRQRALMKEGRGEYASASDYYKVWSMNGFLGQQKLRELTSFERPFTFDQQFIYRYSQEYSQGLIGKIVHFCKIYSGEGREVTRFILEHKDGNFTGEIHPDSIFMQHIWKDDFKIISINNQPRLTTIS